MIGGAEGRDAARQTAGLARKVARLRPRVRIKG